jgi:hypothetical protein
MVAKTGSQIRELPRNWKLDYEILETTIRTYKIGPPETP